MALQANLYGGSLQVLDSNISHDVMVHQAATLAASAVWSIGGGSPIGPIYVTYSLMSLLRAWQFQVAIIAFTLLVFAAKFSNANARNRETASKERITQMETASNERITRMQKEMELEKTQIETASNERIARMQMELTYHLLSSQPDPELTYRLLSSQPNLAALQSLAAKPQAFLTALEAGSSEI